MRRDALRIWQAGVDAVRSDRLVRDNVRVVDGGLEIGDDTIDLATIRHIEVIGAGKAGAGMVRGLEAALTPQVMAEKHVSGWVHVPADCVEPTQTITLHAARPAGVNEPTRPGVEGAAEIMRRVSRLTPDDLCLALISGGGSALLPLPADGITLEDKLAVTRFLSAAGAPIEELNTVRKQLSGIKGGKLAQACRAGQLITLIISDVLGDPLDLIASGPTVPDFSTPADALAVLERYGARQAGIDERVFAVLQQRSRPTTAKPLARVTNLVIGNNAVAVDAAGLAAEQLGYSHAMISAKASEGSAESVGRHLADVALQMRAGTGPDCLISGGEPTVTLVKQSQRGKGGRNQQLVLAAAERLSTERSAGILLLSAGTDGEDGPTDAAGAFVDQAMIEQATGLGLDPSDYLKRNDAYHWFEPVDGLIKTGPTHTNVCDVRVVLVDRVELGERG